MAKTRILVAGLLATFVLPATVLADQPSATSASNDANCNCNQVCADREAAQARARAERRRVAARRAARARRLNASNVTYGPRRAGDLATLHVNTSINRPVTGDCNYRAQARGAYQSRDVTGSDPSAPVRNADIVAEATLTCSGQLVRQESQRFVMPTATKGELANLLHARMSLQVPGSRCNWGSTYGFDGGNLAATGVEGNCSGRDTVAAVQGYTYPQGPERAIGGGPSSDREPSSEDARPGTR